MSLKLPPKMAEDLKTWRGTFVLVSLIVVIIILVGTISWSVYFYEVRKDYTACDKTLSFTDIRDSYYRAHPEITWDDLVKLNASVYLDDYMGRYCPSGGG